MKKSLAWILSALLMLSAVGACAEGAELTFEDLAGLEWCFCSGAGAWSTDMRIFEDGAFSGNFHDSEMGDTGEGYPYGTIYVCSFTGQMTLLGQVDEYAWKVRIDELVRVDEPEEETIEDGTRYIATEIYGLSEGDEMLLYRPGTPVDVLSEDMQFWAHLFFQETRPTELEDWFLSSEQNDSGFVGYPSPDGLSLANPWEELTAEQLLEATGLCFGVPEGAEDVVYRLLPSETLAEMQFTWEGGDYCARIQPAALEAGELMNISGIYYGWENEEAVTIGHCEGMIGLAQADASDWVELCLWYDMVPGLMYSLSVCAEDIDGLDLTAIAEQVYIPAQGND